MKKFIFKGVAMFAILAVSVVACKKETQQVPNGNLNFDNQFNVDSDGKMLVFESSIQYEKLVSNISEEKIETFTKHVEKLDYISLGESNKQSKSSAYENDDFLNVILNEDGIVQIGAFLYKIDLENELVGVLSTSHISEYSDLVLMKKENKNIRRFTTGDDVIDLAESGAESTAKSCGGIDGDNYPCYPTLSSSQLIKTYPDGSVLRLAPFVKHYVAGIYFRLSSQYQILWYENASATSNEQVQASIMNEGFTVEMFIKSPQAWWQKRPCGSGDIGTKTAGAHYSNSVDGSYSVTLYSGMRNLNGYYLFVQGRVRYNDGTYTLASPYGGRNINSPY